MLFVVLCDLACNWSLDGKIMGQIEAGGSARQEVSPGRHSVFARTQDGFDEIRKNVSAEKSGHEIISLELEPMRIARLTALSLGPEKVIAEQQERDQFLALQSANPNWTDPATDLAWRKKDNGSGISWEQAKQYCQTLASPPHSHWRLPTITELQGIYDPEDDWLSHSHARGGLSVSSNVWSSDRSGERVLSFDFNRGIGKPQSDQGPIAALCVSD